MGHHISSPDDVWAASASALAREMAAGRLSPIDVMDIYLQRISVLDPFLHAFVEVYADSARLAAEAADKAIRAESAVGPLHGVPVALKDLIEIEGRITTGGSAQLKNRRSTITATIASRLLGKGMIIVGKTHMVEFALGGWGTNRHMGTPRNPWDRETARTPGGSSSGSGVAVAACLVPWAIGTDTGGSVRIPASYCGITALKPTVGTVSTHGVLPLSQTFDSVGPMARSVEDAALLYSVIQGTDPLDDNTRGIVSVDPMPSLKRGIHGLRLGRLPVVERESVDDDVLEAYDRSLDALTNLGAEIVDVELPFRFVDCFPTLTTIIQAEAYASLANLVDDPKTMIDERIREQILIGRNQTSQEYLYARRQQQVVGRAIQRAMEGIDALLTPTTEMPAVALHDLDEGHRPSLFTRLINVAGLCALALPNGKSRNHLPTSLQIVCQSYQEAMALRIGYAFQQATSWHLSLPAV